MTVRAIMISFAFSLVACGPKNAASSKGTGDKPPKVELTDNLSTPCVLHASGEYAECLELRDGQCFHYGRQCLPEQDCLFDPESSTYRSCAERGKYACSLGATCQPKSSCLLNAERNVYQSCAEFANGQCKRFDSKRCSP